MVFVECDHITDCGINKRLKKRIPALFCLLSTLRGECMPKRRLLVIFGLFIPFAAQANCSSFDAGTQTLEIRTRAANAERVECDASGYALKGDAPANVVPNSSDRRSNTDKLRAFKDLKRQADYLGSPAHYYGQR